MLSCGGKTRHPKGGSLTYVCGWAGSSPRVTFSPWISVKHLSQKWYLPARRPRLGEQDHQNRQSPEQRNLHTGHMPQGGVWWGGSFDGSRWTMKRNRGEGRIRKEGRGGTAQTLAVRGQHHDHAEEDKAKHRSAFGALSSPLSSKRAPSAQPTCPRSWAGSERKDILPCTQFKHPVSSESNSSCQEARKWSDRHKTT